MPEMLTVNKPALDLVVADRQRLVTMAKAIKTQIDDATTQLKNEMAAAGVESLEVGDYVLTLTVRTRDTLDRGALIAAGVSTTLIEQATTQGKPYMQLDVREKR